MPEAPRLQHVDLTLTVGLPVLEAPRLQEDVPRTAATAAAATLDPADLDPSDPCRAEVVAWVKAAVSVGLSREPAPEVGRPQADLDPAAPDPLPLPGVGCRR